MEEQEPVSMIDYLSGVSIFTWPEYAAYCVMYDAGAQFFSENDEEVAFMPFFEMVYETNETLLKDDVLKAQIKRLTAIIEQINEQLQDA